MKRYTVLMVRNYPDMQHVNSHTYMIGRFWTLSGSIEAAKEEIKQRGGKYGAIIYENDRERVLIDRHTATEYKISLT